MLTDVMAIDIQLQLSPARCGVLVVDMQNDFCHRDGLFGRDGVNLSDIQVMMPRRN